MPSPEQSSRQPAGDSPEKICRSFLAIDPQPAIRAANAPKLRAVLTSLTMHLCDRVRSQASDFLTGAPPPDGWPGPCAIGSGMRAGFELYHELCRAVAASWLSATGFDPAQAAAEPGYHAGIVIPSLAAISRDRMRGTLLTLTDRIRATTDDADASAVLSAATRLPDELWDVGTGTTAAMALYRHVVFVQAVDVWYCLHDELGTGAAPAMHPFTPPPPGTLFFPVSPN